MGDPAIWMWRFERRREAFIERCSTRTTYALATAWGIEVAKGSRFFGVPLLRRAPGSSLVVESGCTFRSLPWSNVVGLERRCVLATLGPRAVLRVGSQCGLSGTVINAVDEVILGNRVLCGANVTISDTDRHGVSLGRRTSIGDHAPVSIGDDVWLGMGVVVLKGVSVGAGTVVAAGSLVTRSLPDGVLAAGRPAVVVREQIA